MTTWPEFLNEAKAHLPYGQEVGPHLESLLYFLYTKFSTIEALTRDAIRVPGVWIDPGPVQIDPGLVDIGTPMPEPLEFIPIKIELLPAVKCECGSESVGSSAHSTWCPKFT